MLPYLYLSFMDTPRGVVGGRLSQAVFVNYLVLFYCIMMNWL